MIPLFRPFVSEDLDEITKILYSGNLAFGHYGQRLETALADFLSANNVVFFNTYNSAWQALLKAYQGKINEAYVPSFACAASIQPFNTEGLNIKWLEIIPDTGQCKVLDDYEINERSLVSVGHNCGYLSDIDRFENLSVSGATIVHDCIEAFGSKWRGKYLGDSSLTKIAVFSTDTVRILNTITGGFIACADSNLAEELRIIRDYGIERKHYRCANGEISLDYDIRYPGFGSKSSEINNYIGLKNLYEISSILEMHKKNADIWSRKLDSLNIAFSSLKISNKSSPNYWVYGILVDNKDDVIDRLNQYGFQASGVHSIVALNSVFGNKVLLPGAQEFNRRFLALPCGWWVDIKL